MYNLLYLFFIAISSFHTVCLVPMVMKQSLWLIIPAIAKQLADCWKPCRRRSMLPNWHQRCWSGEFRSRVPWRNRKSMRLGETCPLLPPPLLHRKGEAAELWKLCRLALWAARIGTKNAWLYEKEIFQKIKNLNVFLVTLTPFVVICQYILLGIACT